MAGNVFAELTLQRRTKNMLVYGSNRQGDVNTVYLLKSALEETPEKIRVIVVPVGGDDE